MEPVYLAGAARTPIGRFGGSLASWTAADLGTAVAKESLRRANVRPDQIDDSIWGCGRQAGDALHQRRDGHRAALGTGLVWSAPGQPSCALDASESGIPEFQTRIVGIADFEIKKGSLVNKKILTGILALTSLLIMVGFVLGSGSFARTPSPVATPPAEVSSYLPASDAIALIDMRRLLNETMPRILAGDPAKLAQTAADVEKFKARTGIDLRSFDRVVLAARYVYPSPKITKLETVAIARGTFNTSGLIAAGKVAANGKVREEKYRDATIVVFDIKEQINLFNLWNLKLNELAVCALDSNTLALGNPASVRAAVDAGKKGRANAELVDLASRDANAVIGFGADVPRALLAKLNIGNDALAKDASSIRQVYGALGSIENDVSFMLTARTDNAEAAKNLSDTGEGLKQLGALFIPRIAQPRRALAQSALDNLKITTRGNELEIKTRVAAASLASVIR